MWGRARQFQRGRKSIGSYVSCSGTAYDTAGATKHLRRQEFGVYVGCGLPGSTAFRVAVDREFSSTTARRSNSTGNGKFIVDNVFHRVRHRPIRTTST